MLTMGLAWAHASNWIWNSAVVSWLWLLEAALYFSNLPSKAFSRFSKSSLSINWQLWATIIGTLSLLLAAISFWSSLLASQYAKWTAHKDFAILCMDESTRMLSPACPNSTNITIPAPPGFAQAMSRRSFLDLSAQADHDLGPYHEDNPPDHYFLIESLVHFHDQLDRDFAFPGACSASKYESYKNLLQLSFICSYLIVRHLSRHRYFFRKFLFWELLEMHICGQLTAGIYLVQGAVRRTISVSCYPDSTQNNTSHNTLQEPLIQDKKDEKPFCWTRKTRHLQLFVFIVSICSSLRAPKPNNAASYTQKDPKGSPRVLDFSTFIAVSLFSETLVTIFSPIWERLTTRLFRFLSRNFLRRHLSIRGIVVIIHLTLLNSFFAIYTAALYVLGGFLAHKMSPASLGSMWPLYTTGMMAFNGICEEIADWRRDLPQITHALGLGCAMCGCVDKRFGYRLGNDEFDMNKLSTQEQGMWNTMAKSQWICKKCI